MVKTKKFIVTGMTCAACRANVTKTVGKLNGVKDVDVNLLTGRMSVDYDESLLSGKDITNAVISIGYGASCEEQSKSSGSKSTYTDEWRRRRESEESAQQSMKRRLVTSIILLVPLMYVAMGHMIHLPMPSFLHGTENALISAFTQFLIALPIIFVNRKFYQSGFKALFKRVPNMDSLVALGSSASVLYGIFVMYRMMYGFGTDNMELVMSYSHSLYFESGAMILTLVTVGKYLESRSKAKTSSTLEKLVALAPKTATVIRAGKETTVPTDQIVSGDTVVIKPGESIPVDGIISQGTGYIDQSAITGESIPVEKGVGDSVISATINKNGSFKFTASKVGEETTLAQIIKMVDEASGSKAPIARLADRISGIFVPIVMLIAVVTAVIWGILGKDFEFALNCAVSVLVISCPCALGLATPVAIMVGTGKAAELGILIKSAQSLENLHTVDTVVVDKTGTLTSGHPSVTDIEIIDDEITSDELLSLAASIESGSEHPLAEAVIEKAKENDIDFEEPQSFEAVPGRGIKAVLGKDELLGGNLAFMTESKSELGNAKEVCERLSSQGKTPLLFSKSGKVIGVIAAADTVRKSSLEAVKNLREMGLDVVMLTGDNHLSAQAIGKQLGIENIISDVLPGDKEACVRNLQEKGHKVAMVGDGINDAPALARADIGIAIGAGTDIAIESADIVLMKNSLGDAVNAIKLSRAVIKNIKINLFWAFFYNVLGIPIAAGALYPLTGLLLSPMLGSLAMSLSSLFVVTNALRLRLFKAPSPVYDEEIKINNKDKGEIKMKKTLSIDGMMCEHCRSHVEKALSAVDGVTSVDVSLENKNAVVSLSKDVSNDVLTAAVTEAGYTVTDCK